MSYNNFGYSEVNSKSMNRKNKNLGVMELVQPRNQVIEGTVTQLFSTFGYINDNVVFSKADVIGEMVKVGDKVGVDASFQSTNPTKYKGERVYKIGSSPFGTTTTAILNPNIGKTSGLNEVISRLVNNDSSRWDKGNDSIVPKVQSLTSIKNRLNNKIEIPIRDANSGVTKRTSIGHNDTKPNKKKRKRIVSQEIVKRRAISPIKFHVSPKDEEPVKVKSKSKSKPTYKNYESFGHRELDCAAVRNQWRSICLPKEFFHVSLKYMQSFPLNHPMKLGNNCHFKIMDKKVRAVDVNIDSLLRKHIDPTDADTTFTAKVILLSTDDLAKFYTDTLTVCEENEGETKIPITKAIKFLVASVGLDKEFAIGSAWSPSLDGADPESNPRVLINTAIRTCKAMTGIDLSNCSSWPKFLELHYYRPSQKIEKKTEISCEVIIDVDASADFIEYREPRMETVVYYIPDIWNCVPSPEKWHDTKHRYQEQLACIMCPPPVGPTGVATKPSEESAVTVVEATDVDMVDIELETHEDDDDWGCNDNEVGEDNASRTKNSENAGVGEQPTHFSKLVVAGMKIIDIKKELELRKLNTRGIMEQLKARLKTALDREEAEEKIKEAPAVITQPTVVQPVQATVISDDQKNELKRLYTLPDQPEIIVHQNRKLFSNQMKIRTMSLHSLLSYYDTKIEENTYELAIFAKQFLEMLRRDAVFNIYRSLVVAPAADLVNVDDSPKKSKSMITTSKRTVNKPLLFSCTLLDREKTNKISLEELTTLIEGLGICLSSDQLSSVLDKVKDSSKYLHYRQLTDKVMTDSEISHLLLSDVTEDMDYIRELSMGNRALFDVDSTSMNESIDLGEIEKLKNKLDKSERCRQTIDLRVAEINNETDRHTTLVETQAKEIKKLMEHLTEYKTKYRSLRENSDKYKINYDKLLDKVVDISKLTSSLNKCTSNTVDETKAAQTDRSSSKDSKSKSQDKKHDEDLKKKSTDVEKIVCDLTDSGDNAVDNNASNDHIDLSDEIVTHISEPKQTKKGTKKDEESDEAIQIFQPLLGEIEQCDQS